MIVGTHRLLSKDVRFKDLGLLVVDEEQRFGVAHKERIKQMRGSTSDDDGDADSANNMSLVGIRDMSVIETPPKDRLSIQTNVVKFDAPVIERAIRNELGRGGQVLRPQSRGVDLLDWEPLQRLVPEAKIVLATDRWAKKSSNAPCSASSSAASTSCWRPPSSRTASIFPTRTRSSSTAPIDTAWRSSISCAAASADPTDLPTPIC